MGKRSIPVHVVVVLVTLAGVGWVSRPWAVAAPPGQPAAPSVPKDAGTATSPPIDISGADRIEYDDATQEWVFRGARVVVTRGTMRLEAPEILYHAGDRQVVLPRGGTLATPTFEVTADRLVTLFATRHITTEGHVNGRFLQEEEPSSTPAAPPGGNTPAGGKWVTFTANQIEADDRPDARQIIATGQVVIVREDGQLRGDRVTYNRITQQGAADGNAELVRGSDRLRADHVVADLSRREAEARDHVVLEHGDLRGSADHATYAEGTQTAVLSGHVAVFRGRDTLTAERATVYLDRHLAVVEGHAQIVAYPQGAGP
jgi:lipopolysaccharide export system protein LptA